MTSSMFGLRSRTALVTLLALLAATVGLLVVERPAVAGALDDITIADSSATEDGAGGATPGAVTFTITLDGPTAAAGDSGTWSTTDGSATSSAPGGTGQTTSTCAGTDDFERTTAGTWTIPPTEDSTTITVDLCGDTFPEANEQFTVTIAPAGTPCTGDSDCVATGTIVNNDSVPPSLSIDDPTFTEAGGAQNFTLSLSAAAGQSVTVSYKTTDGTATSGGDYTAVGTMATPATVAFAPGQTTKTVGVTVSPDTVDENNETFHLDILTVTNASIADTQGTATITDDDNAPVLTVSDDPTSEGTTGTGDCTGTQQCVVFDIALSAASGKAVSVDYATENGTATAPADYVAQSGTLTFTAGQTTKTVKVPVNGDAIAEGTQTFKLKLSNAVNSDCTATGADCEGTGTIVEGAAIITVDDSSVAEPSGASANASVTIRLSTAAGSAVTVNYTTSNGSATGGVDYEPTTAGVHFGVGESVKTVTIPVYGDTLDENAETFVVTATSTDDAKATCLGGDCQATVTINDEAGDVPPTVSVNDPPGVTEGSSGPVPINFTVSLSAPSGRPASVDWATVNGTSETSGATGGASCNGTVDFLHATGTVNFAAGDTSETVTVQACGDEVSELTETFTLNLTNPTNASFGDSAGTGTINNDDGAAPTISIDDVGTTEGNSGTKTLTFTVTMSATSGKAVTVGYGSTPTTATAGSSCTSGIDYVTVGPAQLTFAPGETTKTIPVTICGDAGDEANETFTVTLFGATNGVLDPANKEGTGTITDDDATPSLSVDDVRASEGDGSLVFRIRLSAPSGQTVGVDYATSDGTAAAGSDYTAQASRATFAAGETFKDIVISVTNDRVREADETLFLTLSNVANATIADGQATGTIVNDDVQGYWMTASDGGLFNYGVCGMFGSQGGKPLNQPVVGMAPTPSGNGYWQVASDGGIFSYGDATMHGSMGGQPLNQPVVGMAATPDAQGYWLVASDGGIFSFGAAAGRFYGSMGGKPLNKPIVGMAATPTGRGYWMVASDGGIFAFGDATMWGGMGGKPLNQPMVGMAATPDGLGYWLVASDGGIFAFGSAKSFGSTGGTTVSAPIVGMARTPTGKGYWLAGSDGNIYAFGDANALGSMAGQRLNKPMVGIAAFPG